MNLNSLSKFTLSFLAEVNQS